MQAFRTCSPFILSFSPDDVRYALPLLVQTVKWVSEVRVVKRWPRRAVHATALPAALTHVLVAGAIAEALTNAVRPRPTEKPR